jgi:hypothetical protein
METNPMQRLALACLAAIALPASALAHGEASWIMANPHFTDMDNPTVHCCGPSDCERWPDSDVDVQPDGYHIKSTGETIPFRKAYTSIDAQFWRCHRNDMRKLTRCFFAPTGDS